MILACRVELWEKGKQIKVLLLCMSLQELCAMHQKIWFFNCTNDFAEKQGLPAVYYPKKVERNLLKTNMKKQFQILRMDYT